MTAVATFIPAAVVRILQLDDASVRAVYTVTQIVTDKGRPFAHFETREGLDKMKADALYFAQNGDGYETADRRTATRWAKPARTA